MAILILRIAACPALELGLILAIAYTPWGINCSAVPPSAGTSGCSPRPSPWPWWRLEGVERRCRAGAVVHGQGRKGLEVA